MTTEKHILEAARKVFVEKGFDGARMQEIADEAGINKALLHYYFRSKDKLFEQIFSEAFHQIRPVFAEAFATDPDIHHFIRVFVSSYIQLLRQMPYLPQFIIQELNRNPQRLVQLIGKQQIPVEDIKAMIEREVSKGRLVAITPQHLMINIMALIIFPFVARPLIQAIFMAGSHDAYEQFLQERQEEIIAFVYRAIQPPNPGL